MRVRGPVTGVLVTGVVLGGCTQAPLPTGGADSAVVSSRHRSTSASSAATSTARPSATTSSPRSSASSSPVPGFGAASALAVVSGHPVIVLNPGHNGGDADAADQIDRLVPSGFGQTKPCDTTGAETNSTNYPEHAFNWDVALRVRTILQVHGVTVRLTRSTDTGVGPCVDERAQIGNQPGVAAVVSIHADGAPVDGHGFHVEECSREPAGPAVAALSHSLAVAEHNALLAGSGMTTSSYLGTDGYLSRDDLAGLNLATVPATFLELGNMRNDGDAAIQSSPDGRQRIAAAVAAGIIAWLTNH